MKKHNLILIAAIVLGALTFNACHTHEEEDPNAPAISVTSPAADAAVSGVVTISGLVTDESLHEMSIVITRDSDNSELFKSEPEVHDLTSYTINESWTPPAWNEEIAVTLTISAEDHSSHLTTKTVKFKVTP